MSSPTQDSWPPGRRPRGRVPERNALAALSAFAGGGLLVFALAFDPDGRVNAVLLAAEGARGPVDARYVSPSGAAGASTPGGDAAIAALDRAESLAMLLASGEDRTRLDDAEDEDSANSVEAESGEGDDAAAERETDAEPGEERVRDQRTDAVETWTLRFAEPSTPWWDDTDEPLLDEPLDAVEPPAATPRRPERFVDHHPGGSIRAEGALFDGERVGTWREWGENGQPSLVAEYDEGEPDGEWRTWHENGEPREEGRYLNSRRHGRWIQWHPNGVRRSEVDYRQGRREGYSQEWYSNGQVKEAGHYREGRREGYWQFFNFQGRPDRRTGHYQSGRRLR